MQNSLKKRSIVALALCLALSLGLFAACGNTGDTSSVPSGPEVQTTPEVAEPQTPDEVEPPAVAPEGAYNAIALPDEMRAMWISYLELDTMDTSSEEALRAEVQRMFDNCADIGLNTVMVSVRPFSDSIYPSEIYPWSHYITGEQGVDPGYDPLAVMIEEAHARGLRFEAAINPYRVKLDATRPPFVSEQNPAVQYPGRAVEIGTEIWFDPGQPEVRGMVIDGVREIVENYDVDGIHFDDYFYPESGDSTFDEDTYAQYGDGKTLADWRRENVNLLVEGVYEAIKAVNPTVIFGIAPQGNNDNNYNGQYSDVNLWMRTAGYVDYVMPQLYWGFDWNRGDNSRYAFGNIANEWAAYEKLASVKLYAGLGAYRIGNGDGSETDSGEWDSGHNLAKQVEYLRGVDGYSGYMLFRYDFLFSDENPLYAAEAEALKTVNNA